MHLTRFENKFAQFASFQERFQPIESILYMGELFCSIGNWIAEQIGSQNQSGSNRENDARQQCCLRLSGQPDTGTRTLPIARKNHSRYLTALVPACLVLTAAGLAFYKIAYLDYDLSAVKESESYFIETVVQFDGHGSDVDIALTLPRNDRNQTITDEAFSSNDMRFKVESSDAARLGIWHGDQVSGTRTLKYTSTVFTKEMTFGIDSSLSTRQPAPKQLGRLLLSDSLIQSDDPEIARLIDSLGLSEDSTILSNLQKAFDYVTIGLKYVQYSGTTDALTAYHLGEASCGGKSRLFAAMTRHLGIPTRLVGGKILSSGQSKATHIWTEVYVHGHWVPFCPTNNYFARIPSTYLVLYYGEMPFVSHTRDINFKYYFNLKKRLVSNA
ncbi:MAG: transglutaminase family protein, partial [Candidatus Zixiibacteriota bacterium]